LFLCSTVAPLAQSPAAPPQGAPDVTVIKHSWSKERINWEGNPFGGTVESFDDMRRRIADQRRLERARSGGVPGEAGKIEREMRSEQVIKSRPPAPPRYAFLYKASVRNTGEKTIREIDWDYAFFDVATGQEMGRCEFTTAEKISPGKQKELTVFSPSPPSRTISVDKLDKRERDTLSERIVIMRILYDDGTVWQRP
jgi:hypothetical protein